MRFTIFPCIRLAGIISFLFMVHKCMDIISMWLLFEGGPYMRKDAVCQAQYCLRQPNSSTCNLYPQKCPSKTHFNKQCTVQGACEGEIWDLRQAQFFLHGQYLRQPKPSSFSMQTRDFFFQIDAQQYTMVGILNFFLKKCFTQILFLFTPTPWLTLLSVLGKNHVKQNLC